MKEMKKLDNRELNEVMDFARELMVMNGKLEFTPGTKVYVVQKTKKTPGVVRKVLQKNAVVDLDTGGAYRVPMSMLEAAQLKGTNKPRQNFQVRNEQKKKFKKKPSKEDNSTGLSVKVGDDFNKAMRLFKKKVLNDGRLNEIHERQFFTKRSEKKRLARAAGKQRWLRKFAETPGPHQPKKRTNQRKRIS